MKADKQEPITTDNNSLAAQFTNKANPYQEMNTAASNVFKNKEQNLILGAPYHSDELNIKCENLNVKPKTKELVKKIQYYALFFKEKDPYENKKQLLTKNLAEDLANEFYG